MRLQNKMKVPYGSYFFIIIVLYISLAIFTFPDALDLTRYYEVAILDSKTNVSLIDYIKDSINRNTDFLYFTSLFVFAKLGISLNFVTTFFMAVYYICCLELFRRNKMLFQTNKAIVFYALMCAPYIWVLEISRNLAAISLLYLAIMSFLRCKKYLGVILIVVSIFTHVSMTVYIPILLIAYILSKKVYMVKNKYIAIAFLALIVMGYLSSKAIVNVMAILTEDTNMRYSYYATYENVVPLISTHIGYGDKMPMLLIFIYSIVIVIINKNKDFFFWMLLLLTGMLSFALFSSLMLTNRIIMLMPLFIVGNLCSILNEQKQKNKFYILSLIGSVCVLAHFYAYRLAFNI